MQNRKFQYIAPFENAIQQNRKLLFTPFQLSFYLKLALIAWLSSVSIPMNFNLNGNDLIHHVKSFFQNDSVSKDESTKHESVNSEGEECTSPVCNNTDDSTAENTFLQFFEAIPVAVIIIVAVIAIFMGLLFLWLQCRGQFMLIDALAVGDDLPIRDRWGMSAKQGNALFRFYLISGVILFTGALLLSGAVGVALYLLGRLALVGIAVLCLFLPFLFILALLIGLLFLLHRDWGTLLMYQTGITPFGALKDVLSKIDKNKWHTFRYLMFILLYQVAMGAIIIIGGIMTCCIGFLILVIPVLGTALILPLLVIRQYFVMNYAKQFGADYNVYPNTTETNGELSIVP